ncbi:hypothetical protein Tco_0154975 [Tanacetum coccineum]
MVAYLHKPEGSEAFHQIVDFLNTSHIKYALIENPKIYISLIQQFWGTATTRITDDGEVEITASIDGQVKTITEASLRRYLKLEDSYVADEATFTSVDVDARGAATTNIGLEACQGSGTMHKTPTMPYDLPLPRVHILGSDEGSLQQNELMDLVTKLTNRVEVFENELQQTMKVYSSALIKLILRVKKLEKKVKTNKAMKRARIVISEDEDAEEDSSKQGRKISKIDKDPTILLVHPEQDMEYDFDVSTTEGFTTASVPVTTASASISTVNPPRVYTAEDISGAETLVYIRRSVEKRKDKGKAIMKEDESVQKKAKKQLEKERLGHEESIRLQEQINEEEKQRIVRDAKIAKQLEEEFDRARQEQEVVAEADQAYDIDWSDPAGGYKQSHFKGMSYKDIRPIFERVWDQNNAFVPKDSEIEKGTEQVMIESSKKAGGRLKRKVSNARNDKDKRQKMQDDLEKITLKEYVEVISYSEEVIGVIPLAVKSLIGDLKIIVHSLILGEVSIHMLVEKKYPLPQDTLTRMLQWKLHVNNDVTEMAYKLLREDCWELNSLDLVLPSQSVSTARRMLVLLGLTVPIFSPGDDPIDCLNKAMDFLTAVAFSRFPSTNNQLRTSSNPRNQDTIQDNRVTVQQVQGRQGQSYSGAGYKSNATSSGGSNASGQAKDKAMLAEAQEAGQISDEEQLAFLAYLGILDGQAIQTIIPNNVAFQTGELDTFDSDCNDISNTKAILMANISNYGSDVISEVPYSDTYLNDGIENQSVHAM